MRRRTDYIKPTEQKCSRCNQVKSVSQFPTRCDRNEPLKHCLTCHEAAQAQETLDAKNALLGVRQCSHCHETKPLEQFGLRSARGQQRHFRCLQCFSTYSARHYLASQEREQQRAIAGGEALAASGKITRACNQCKRELSFLQFARDSRSSDGYKRVCRECDQALSRRRRVDEGKERDRLTGVNVRRYGLTQESFAAILAHQDHACKVCGTLKRDVEDKYGFHIDHNHQTRRVRGFLCRGCNAALGHVKDDPKVLRGLIRYLEVTANTPAFGATTEEWTAHLAGREKGYLAY